MKKSQNRIKTTVSDIDRGSMCVPRRVSSFFLARGVFLVIMYGFMSLITGCSLFKAKANIEITLVGEKTSLENQVLGNFSFIGSDKMLMVSIRTMPDDIRLISDSQRRAFLAFQNRNYNRDDYERFMDKGVIGEASNGFIIVRDAESIKSDASMRAYVERLISEESRDRGIIFERIIEVTEGLSSSDVAKVQEIFAKKFRNDAKIGWWIQEADGTWVQKK